MFNINVLVQSILNAFIEDSIFSFTFNSVPVEEVDPDEEEPYIDAYEAKLISTGGIYLLKIYMTTTGFKIKKIGID